ncbi:RidA family protein [Methylosinus sporium]|uniref:RidA family protein n=1 Tax=Methylosinus sporium TaxID=428 RepID=UPI00383BAF0A
MSKLLEILSIGAISGTLVSSTVRAEEIIRYPLPTPIVPISLGVEIPAGKTLVFLSGAVPFSLPDKDGKTLPPPVGTQAQAKFTLERIRQSLEALHLTLGDVVFLRAYLVGDPATGGKLDFNGFNAAYKQFFGTAEQPALPSRTVVQVAGLASPDFLVEIEVVAARK